MLLAGVFQINPIWNLGPYNPSQVSAGVQPDFYMGFLDGMVRVWPAWETRNLFGHYMVPAVFFPSIGGATLSDDLVMSYPFIEKKFTKDNAMHNILQRPRDVPVRTSLGVAFLAFYILNLINGANDLFALKLDISLNVMTWVGRIGSIVACRCWPTPSPTGCVSASSTRTGTCWNTASRRASSGDCRTASSSRSTSRSAASTTTGMPFRWPTRERRCPSG